MREERIGEVVKFFSKPCVAAVKITAGELNIGDRVKFSGFTTDHETTIESIEVDNQRVNKALPGEFVGIKVGDRVRPGDELLKLIAE